MKTQEHTAGAMRAARYLINGEENCEGALAEIIDRETRLPQLLEAVYGIRAKLKEADRQTSYGTEMDVCIREAIGLADDAIRSAKGETL